MIYPTEGYEHLILGDGNLGKDLAGELAAVTDSVATIPFRIIDTWRSDSMPTPHRTRTIWYCVGGRHAEAKRDPRRSARLNIEIPRMLMDRADRNTRLVFFSTADCAHPEYPSRPDHFIPKPKSEFAEQKLALEGTVKASGRPFTAVVRLSSIYGTHKPLATFPGRLLQADWGGYALSLPANEVTPTPSAWAAIQLIMATETNLWRDDKPTIHHLSPIGSIEAHEWAKLVFGPLRGNLARAGADHGGGFVDRRHYDETRPRRHALGCSLQVTSHHWSTLWTTYFQREAYQ